MYCKSIIEDLRKKAIKPTICYDKAYLCFLRALLQDTESNSLCLKYAHALNRAFSSATPSFEKGELILGRADEVLSATEQEEFASLKEQAEKYICHCGQDSHMAVDYEKLLRLGISGIRKEASQYLAQASLSQEKKDFYQSCIICLDAVVAFSKNYVLALRKAAEEEADTDQKTQWLLLAELCEKVPAQPAETFHEAIQSVHFLSFCLSFAFTRHASQQFQLGRPDRYLYPFYQKDIADGTLTKEDAQMLIDCLAIQINRRVPNGLSSGYMLGGRKADGSIVQNELTEMFMQTIDNVRLVYPAVGLCYTKGMEQRFLKKACEILSHGRSHPAIFNDDIIQSGLRSYGVPPEESCAYIQSTCVEITPIASSNVWVASPYTNMPQLLLDILDREYNSFEELMATYFARLDTSIKNNFLSENNSRRIRAEKTCNPLLSCFVNDCLSNGVDIEQGGARYNWIMPSFVGIANLVDALYTIRELVFLKKEFSIGQLQKILQENFEGNEQLRLRILNKIPKYGNDNDDIDCFFSMITEHLVSECKKYTPMFQNGRLIPSVFCWIMHERFGTYTGATPDGRKAGFPLGDGSGPCQGREANGPTASILSSTKWSHKEFIGGVAVNMKFSEKIFSEESIDKICALIEQYMALGGFEMQINVVSRQTLLNAQKNPEAYADLVVRIGGYSDYFVRLSPQMQAEVLLRTEHSV